MEIVLYKMLLKIRTNALGFINVILFHKDHRHVSATHMAFFRVVRPRTHITFRITTLKWPKHVCDHSFEFFSKSLFCWHCNHHAF